MLLPWENPKILISEENEEDVILRETSFLLGNVLKDDNVLNDVATTMAEVDKHDELVSFSYLLGSEENINKEEDKQLKSGKVSLKRGVNLFKDAIIDEVLANDYGSISNLMSKKGYNTSSSKSSEDFVENLIETLAGENLYVYLPYEEELSTSKGAEDDFYITYAPTYYAETNEVFKYEKGGTSGKTANFKSVGIKDNDFVDSHRVFVLGRMDECEMRFAKCDFIDPIAQDPEPLVKGPKLLTYNVNHTSIEQKDILSTRFSGYKVYGSNWTGFGATHLKLVILRGAPDAKISISGADIIAETKAFNIGYFVIRAKGARKGWWYDCNEEFDNDWDMTENEQMIAVFTRHHFKGESSTTLATKIGGEFEKGKIKPVAEATKSSSLKVTVGSAKFRTKASLSRRQVLSTIVGDSFGNGTRDGTNWSAKKSQIFYFYFKHYYTDL